jgi:hypothetical protein
VRMRSRKPCTRARRRLFGWKVRLPLATVETPHGDGLASMIEPSLLIGGLVATPMHRLRATPTSDYLSRNRRSATVRDY